MAIERLMLEGMREPVSHYCHGVRAGDRVWVSGMVGCTPDGHIPDDVVEQFRIAMNSVDKVLRAVGGGPANVVKVQVFVTDMNDREKINPLRQDYFGEHRPASTLVEVSGLVDPRMKVEIEAEAVLG